MQPLRNGPSAALQQGQLAAWLERSWVPCATWRAMSIAQQCAWVVMTMNQRGDWNQEEANVRDVLIRTYGIGDGSAVANAITADCAAMDNSNAYPVVRNFASEAAKAFAEHFLAELKDSAVGVGASPSGSRSGAILVLTHGSAESLRVRLPTTFHVPGVSVAFPVVVEHRETAVALNSTPNPAAPNLAAQALGKTPFHGNEWHIGRTVADIDFVTKAERIVNEHVFNRCGEDPYVRTAIQEDAARVRATPSGVNKYVDMDAYVRFVREKVHVERVLDALTKQWLGHDGVVGTDLGYEPIYFIRIVATPSMVESVRAKIPYVVDGVAVTVEPGEYSLQNSQSNKPVVT